MKVLLIRFSSFGDIVQCLPAATALKTELQASVDWAVRSDFQSLIEKHPSVAQTHSLNKKEGWAGLWKMSSELSAKNYTHIYDAHSNLRSHLLCWILWWRAIFHLQAPPKILRRSKQRLKRWLYFRWRLKVLPTPFRGALSFTKPLEAWGVSSSLPKAPQLFLVDQELPTLPKNFIALAPSAAWPTKRWPVDHWKALVPLLKPWPLVILGGPEDHFCQEIADVDPERCLNLAGKIRLEQSCAVVEKSRWTISADTGILHAADQLGTANLGLIGPTAFGYTSQPQSKILETELPCKPCSKDGRDPCVNPVYQKCMRDLAPTAVAKITLDMLGIEP